MTKKKKLTDLPTDQAIHKLFPKEVVDKAKEVAHEKDPKPQPQLQPLPPKPKK